MSADYLISSEPEGLLDLSDSLFLLLLEFWDLLDFISCCNYEVLVDALSFKFINCKKVLDLSALIALDDLPSAN